MHRGAGAHQLTCRVRAHCWHTTGTHTAASGLLMSQPVDSHLQARARSGSTPCALWLLSSQALAVSQPHSTVTSATATSRGSIIQKSKAPHASNNDPTHQHRSSAASQRALRGQREGTAAGAVYAQLERGMTSSRGAAQQEQRHETSPSVHAQRTIPRRRLWGTQSKYCTFTVLVLVTQGQSVTVARLLTALHTPQHR